MEKYNTASTKKILAVYNTCGISGKDNTDFYLQALDAIFQQDFIDFDVVMSSCLNTESTINRIREGFGSKININWTKDILPVNVTFNHSIVEQVKRFGEYDSYLFIDSDVIFQRTDDFLKLFNILKSGPHGVVSARTNTDMGLEWWFNTNTDKKLLEEGDFVLPLGKAINSHCQIYSNEIFNTYGRILSDIFAAYCSESVMPFICAAIKKNWVLAKDVLVFHKHYMDESSSGFDPEGWRGSGNKHYDHPFKINSIMERVGSQTARRLGLGYEECDKIVMHDESQYDGNGFCINEELKNYIKENLYLKKDELDYDKINHDFFVKE